MEEINLSGSVFDFYDCSSEYLLSIDNYYMIMGSFANFFHLEIFANPFRMSHGSSDSGSKIDMEPLSDQFDIHSEPTKSYVRNT